MSPRAFTRVAALVLTAWFLATNSLAAYAEEDSPNLAARAVKVRITVIGSHNEFRWARTLVGSRGLGSLPPQWSRADHFDLGELLDAPHASREGSLDCWLDLSEAVRARLYFAAPSGERFLLRDVALSGRMNDVDRESLAEVLDLSVAALLENERAGLTRVEAKELLAKQPPPRTQPDVAATKDAVHPPDAGPAVAAATSSPARTFTGLGVFWAAQAIARTLPFAQGPGVVVSAGRAWPRRWLAGFVSAQYQWPATERRPDIGVRLETLAARAGAELALARWRMQAGVETLGSALWTRLGLGLDMNHISPQAGTRDTTATLTSSRWAPNPVLASSLGVTWALADQSQLDVQVFADVLPVGVRYEVQVAGATQTAFSTWRLRPGIAIGLTFR